MQAASSQAVTGLLRAWSRGDAEAREQLFPIIYGELRRQAARFMRRELPGHTLRPTALVHEVYLRLVGDHDVAWRSRAQFFAVAAEMMRRILVDHARARGAAKRGGGWRKVSLDETVAAGEREIDLVALDEALKELAMIDLRQSRIVELRFFSGLSNEAAAEVIGVSPATVKREWAVARAWLYRRLQPQRS